MRYRLLEFRTEVHRLTSGAEVFGGRWTCCGSGDNARMI